jgi:hypothetical protein
MRPLLAPQVQVKCRLYALSLSNDSMALTNLDANLFPVRKRRRMWPPHHEGINMERALAEQMVGEILAMGESLNRLNDLIEAHVAEGAVKTQIKRALGEAMGSGAVLLLPIVDLHPDLDPDK